MDLRNNKVVVVGLGTSGLDACLLLNDVGTIVSVTDNNDNESVRKNAEILKRRYIETEIGKHTKEFLEGCHLIVTSPGVSNDALPIKHGINNNIPIISELELGFGFTKAPIIAITGTNGKSTVVTLVGEILKKAGKKTVVCGNIGNSLSGEIRHMDDETICVLEVSSFQLEWIFDFRPRVSCILNITEDHLERYRDFDDYAKTKLKIFSNQTKDDIAIFNYDDHRLRSKVKDAMNCKKLYYSRVEKVEGIYFKDGDLIYDIGKRSKKLFRLPHTNLKGEFNIENILAAVLICLTQEVDIKTIETALRDFKGLPHRIESVGEIRGVEFIDDSKATNIDAAKRALESIDKKVILIAGGRDKGGDYNIIKDLVISKVKLLVLIGEAAPLIEKVFKGAVPIEKSATLEGATQIAFELAEKGDMVLLSPMCSSFDMFHDYKHRGEVFRDAVDTLKSKVKSIPPKAGSRRISSGGTSYGKKSKL